jgi:hypothetical protein
MFGSRETYGIHSCCRSDFTDCGAAAFVAWRTLAVNQTVSSLAHWHRYPPPQTSLFHGHCRLASHLQMVVPRPCPCVDESPTSEEDFAREVSTMGTPASSLPFEAEAETANRWPTTSSTRSAFPRRSCSRTCLLGRTSRTPHEGQILIPRCKISWFVF